jgi:hypothetical protein
MLNDVMLKIFVAAACLVVPFGCDPEENSESEATPRSEPVECLDPSDDSRVRMSVQVIPEAVAERRIAAAGGDVATYECVSPGTVEDDDASDAPPWPTDLDRTAPPKHSLAGGFCIEICCSGKLLCFVEK